MIVGITSLTDVNPVVASAHRQDVGGQINVPVGFSLDAAGVIIPFAGLIDPEVEGANQSFSHTQTRHLASGEQVCALQYRKVSHKWFSNRRIGSASPSKTRQWSCWRAIGVLCTRIKKDEGEMLKT